MFVCCKQVSCSVQSKMSVLLHTFGTEEELTVHREYFAKFKEEVVRLNAYCEKVLLDKTVNISERLLDYEGEPVPVNYQLHAPKNDFRAEFEFNNRRVNLNKNLKTVKNRSKIATSLRGLKYENYQFLPMPFDLVRKPPDFKHLVFTVKVYRPFHSAAGFHPKILQEIQMLGLDTLNNLRNIIKCSTDYCGIKDVSEDIGRGTVGALNNEREQHYPRSFFLINSTFHRDKRFQVDLTEPTIKWLLKKGIETNEVPNMDAVLQDLPIQVGRPYLYQHQGDCEHIVVFSDVKCSTNVEEADLIKYPFVSAISASFIRNCMLCVVSHARWLVKNCMKLTIARAFLCHRCLLSYCYIDGRKTGQFQVYQYVDPAVILP